MKKLMASVLFGVLCAAPVSAQNVPGRFDAYAIGAPDFTLNSGGTKYGQEFSNAGDSQWSLGYGTTQSTSGTALLTWSGTTNSVLVGSTATITTIPGTFVVYSTGTHAGDNVINVVDHLGVTAFYVADEGGTFLRARSKATLFTAAPIAVGELFTCSDCTDTYATVVGTGTSANQWRELGVPASGIH